MAKLTFSMDDETVRTLKATAVRLRKPQSMIVREAVADYAARAGRLTQAERRRMLADIAVISRRPPTRPQAEVGSEMRAVRRDRHSGRPRHPQR